MRVTVVFFLFLCFSFLGSTSYFFSSPNHSITNQSSASSINKTTHRELLNTVATSQLNKHTELVIEENHFVITEDEEDHVSDRKLVLTTQFFASLSPYFGLTSIIKYFKVSLPFCSHLSNSPFKYILQRVLRI